MCFSGASVHNVHAEEEEETESASSEQQTLENSITMSKMKQLKAKMENMNLNKKVQQNRETRHALNLIHSSSTYSNKIILFWSAWTPLLPNTSD